MFQFMQIKGFNVCSILGDMVGLTDAMRSWHNVCEALIMLG